MGYGHHYLPTCIFAKRISEIWGKLLQVLRGKCGAQCCQQALINQKNMMQQTTHLDEEICYLFIIPLGKYKLLSNSSEKQKYFPPNNSRVK